ncbi:hypothetical protein [Lewinella sp. IMCC34191]|uniref:hypothetical protein n=1 Tax=Lewinella sp. IMCC34191 TaxID=2259172 RepID=UPI000E22E651|nr:hypothetical protein [Lewinella sp. IMCC34191]
MRYLPILFCCLLTAACSTPRTATSPPEEMVEPDLGNTTYAGDWDITVMDTPGGTVKGVLSLTGSGDELDGTINVNGSSVDLSSVERTDDGLMIEFYSTEYQTTVDLKLKGQPSADELTGTALNTYMTVATRKM